MIINPFGDQSVFMQACGQTVQGFNNPQLTLYLNLIREECQELWDANSEDDRVEMLDALVDILVVTIGAIHSMGADAEGAWNEVMRTNMAKIDPKTGLVRRREDGKILKPDNFVPPDLKKFLSHYDTTTQCNPSTKNSKDT